MYCPCGKLGELSTDIPRIRDRFKSGLALSEPSGEKFPEKSKSSSPTSAITSSKSSSGWKDFESSFLLDAVEKYNEQTNEDSAQGLGDELTCQVALCETVEKAGYERRQTKCDQSPSHDARSRLVIQVSILPMWYKQRVKWAPIELCWANTRIEPWN